MALHPQAIAFLAELSAAPAVPLDSGYEQIRAAGRDFALAATDRVHIEHVADVDADGVGCRVYRPYDGAPVALYVHGGGWVMHDLETHDAFCRYLSAESGWALLAVDYRRAPEHPYPAPLDDVRTAATWLRASAGTLGVDASFLPGIGDSSGANLIAGLLVRDPKALDFQVLMYPPVDRHSDTESMKTEDCAALDAESMNWFWDSYAPGDLGRLSEVSPLRADNLGEHPPALIVSAEHDILRDQVEQYATGLAEAGVEVQASRSLGMVHSFWRQPNVFDASRALVRDVYATLNARAGRL
ncbi:MAG: alpha/beta hydrolase [Aeromicrobium sp.]